MFWGPKELQAKLGDGGRVQPFCENQIKGASYQLSIGEEVYVSPTDDATDSSSKSITRLKEREAFAIPPGQFAFLLTQEVVKVELEEIAFISIRAKTKYRGLVNVSGFHVDPGFTGRLTFAVFNAGPVTVHLRRGQDIFLIWFADLSDPSEEYRPKGPRGIQSEFISGIGGKLHSLASLASAVDNVEQKFEKRLSAVTRELAIFRVTAAIIATLLIGVVIRLLSGPGS